MTVKEYKIVTHIAYDFIEEQVNEMAKGGWEPQGGLTINKDGRYFQAMIKRG